MALARKTQSKLFHHTAEIIKETGLPCIHSDEHTQKGHDFGTKLSNAIEDVFTQGYSSVIVLGNDCPQLNSTILETASLQLSENQVLVGPSQAGGVYLMGFQKSGFDKKAFQNLPWQNKELKASLLEYFKNHSTEASLLPFLADLNRYQELSFFVGLKNISRNISLVFQALIQCLMHLFHQDSHVQTSFISISPISHRGPPPSC